MIATYSLPRANVKEKVAVEAKNDGMFLTLLNFLSRCLTLSLMAKRRLCNPSSRDGLTVSMQT